MEFIQSITGLSTPSAARAEHTQSEQTITTRLGAALSQLKNFLNAHCEALITSSLIYLVVLGSGTNLRGKELLMASFGFSAWTVKSGSLALAFAKMLPILYGLAHTFFYRWAAGKTLPLAVVTSRPAQQPKDLPNTPLPQGLQKVRSSINTRSQDLENVWSSLKSKQADALTNAPSKKVSSTFEQTWQNLQTNKEYKKAWDNAREHSPLMHGAKAKLQILSRKKMLSSAPPAPQPRTIHPFIPSKL